MPNAAAPAVITGVSSQRLLPATRPGVAPTAEPPAAPAGAGVSSQRLRGAAAAAATADCACCGCACCGVSSQRLRVRLRSIGSTEDALDDGTDDGAEPSEGIGADWGAGEGSCEPDGTDCAGTSQRLPRARGATALDDAAGAADAPPDAWNCANCCCWDGSAPAASACCFSASALRRSSSARSLSMRDSRYASAYVRWLTSGVALANGSARSGDSARPSR